MIRSIYRAPDGKTLQDLDVGGIQRALVSASGLLWLDLTKESRDEIRVLFREIFDFHPLAVDDALDETHMPKVDDWGDYLYLVLHEIEFDPQTEGLISTHELDFFLGRNYLVTYHVHPVASLDRVWNACTRDDRTLQQGSGRLLYRLSDELVTDHMSAVEGIDEVLDQVEDRVFEKPDPTLLGLIFSLKRASLNLRRILNPQREVFNKLSRGDHAVIQAEDQVFFRDVYDHLVRLYDITEGIRDLVGGAVETYLSVVSNRTNEIMKTLTIITTFFMPLAFITGFFGMNFFQPVFSLPAWTGQAAFVAVLVMTVLIPLGMYLWMRGRKWA